MTLSARVRQTGGVRVEGADIVFWIDWKDDPSYPYTDTLVLRKNLAYIESLTLDQLKAMLLAEIQTRAAAMKAQIAQQITDQLNTINSQALYANMVIA